jgi:HEAT repeat protein
MFRVDHGEVVKVRLFSPACQIDIGDLTLHWITGVRTSDSIAFLKTLSPTDGMRVVSAIGAHADPAADAYLRETAESQTADRRDRERAAMMLASTRGASGMAVVLRLLKDDTDEKLRASLPGALAQAPNFAGTNTLMDVATTDKDRKVRERAFFWLGRSKDPRAQKFIEEILSK